MWVVFRSAPFEHGIFRAQVSTGIIEAIKQFQPADRVFANATSDTLMQLSEGVIEIGRSWRIIRIDAQTLERLPDVKVVGDVVAFDETEVTTRFTDQNGVSAYRFIRPSDSQ